jgi:Domain of unknown function DUF29
MIGDDMTQIRYEQDIVAWAREQAMLLRSGQLSAVDAEHLAEEIEAVSASERRELRNRLKVLLQHLLKWQYQPERRSRSWLATMLEQRDSIDDVLTTSPSLRTSFADDLESAYSSAVRYAAEETGKDARAFPRMCPFSFDDVLSDGWLPEDV